MKPQKNFVKEKIRKGYSGSVLRKLAKQLEARIAIQKAANEPPKPVNLLAHWTPNEGPQSQFYHSECREILFGGAAGGGKSSALTAILGKYSYLPGCNMVVFRREATQFLDLIEKSKELFPKIYPGLDPIHSPHFVWNFPSSAKANYRHLQHEKSASAYDGWEINVLGFDELTHFTEKQYKALCARVRSSKPGYPRYIRATTNPGGEGHEWVFRHWGAWLNPEFSAPGLPERLNETGKRIPPAKPGEVWWVRTNEDGTERYFSEDPSGTEDDDPENPALSRTFIPSKLSDNPHLAENDPNYIAELNKLDPVRRAQLRDGDWTIKPSAGLYFKRDWVQFVDPHEVPQLLLSIRAWDLASTENPSQTSGIDWTSGTKMGFTRDAVYILDQRRAQLNPAGVEALIKSTAIADGRNVAVFLPQDPGQAGKSQVHQYALNLQGFCLLTERMSGDKVTRFAPFSAWAEPRGGVKKVFMVRGQWNNALLDELESFPSKGIPDDQVDSTGDAFSRGIQLLTKRQSPRGSVEVIENSDR